MWWCFAYRGLVMLRHHTVAAIRNVSLFFGSTYLANFKKLFQSWDIFKNRLYIHKKQLVFFGYIVNYFTNCSWLTFIGYIPHQVDTVIISRNIPNRTIRRVHVMPWATPIRRIGCLRMQQIEGENDDPANLSKILIKSGLLIMIA